MCPKAKLIRSCVALSNRLIKFSTLVGSGSSVYRWRFTAQSPSLVETMPFHRQLSVPFPLQEYLPKLLALN